MKINRFEEPIEIVTGWAVGYGLLAVQINCQFVLGWGASFGNFRDLQEHDR
jgi:hypothetical protein